jgi:hypothetical protein
MLRRRAKDSAFGAHVATSPQFFSPPALFRDFAGNIPTVDIQFATSPESVRLGRLLRDFAGNILTVVAHFATSPQIFRSPALRRDLAAFCERALIFFATSAAFLESALLFWKARRFLRAAAGFSETVLLLVCRRSSRHDAASFGRRCASLAPSSLVALAFALLFPSAAAEPRVAGPAPRAVERYGERASFRPQLGISVGKPGEKRTKRCHHSTRCARPGWS